MTLTSVLPTLRRSLPDPLARDAWPAGTTATPGELAVSGVSVARFVELCGTPAVMTAPAVVPLSGGVASSTATTSIVIASVQRIDDGPVPVLVMDASYAACAPAWTHARIVGRICHRTDARFAIAGPDGDHYAGVAVLLPADIEAGDLIAVPCPGALGVGDVRPDSAGRER